MKKHRSSTAVTEPAKTLAPDLCGDIVANDISRSPRPPGAMHSAQEQYRPDIVPLAANLLCDGGQRACEDGHPVDVELGEEEGEAQGYKGHSGAD